MGNLVVAEKFFRLHNKETPHLGLGEVTGRTLLKTECCWLRIPNVWEDRWIEGVN